MSENDRTEAYRIYMTDGIKVICGAERRYIDAFEEPEDPPDSAEVITSLRDRLKKMRNEEK